MVKDSASNIKDSLAGNNGKICHVKTEELVSEGLCCSLSYQEAESHEL